MSVTTKDLNNLVKWTKDYIQTAVPAGKYQAIVGLSGGIDSAVAAALCVKAIGPEKVLGLILPCDSDPIDSELAWDLCDSLDIAAREVNLEDSFYAWKKAYKSQLEADKRIPRLVFANAKARLRMTTLYAAAGQFGGLVIGTTNKTEMILGYATKYGDNGVDIEPLQDFYKCEIYELAGYFIDIPKQIISRAPTAGLWDGQTDEGELGMTYEQIDFLLAKYGISTLCQMADGAIPHTKYAVEATNKIAMLYRASLHKDFNLPHFIRG